MSGRHAAPRTVRAIPGRTAAARIVTAAMLAIVLGATPAASATLSHPAAHVTAAPRALALQRYSAPSSYAAPAASVPTYALEASR